MINENTVIMWRNSPVLGMIVLIGIIFLMVGKETIELNALLEIFDSFEASNVFQEIKISVNINACSDKSMPVDTLQFNISVVFLEFEIDRHTEVDVRSLDCVHIFTSHLELIELEVFWKYLHI